MPVVINTLDEIDILVRESPQNLIVWIVVPNQGRLGRTDWSPYRDGGL